MAENKEFKKTKAYAKTPTVFQMEATECGAASLTMIMGYFGKEVPLEQMRIETGVSRDGSKASNIVKAARKLGLNSKGYRYSLKKLLNEASVPCIIHWNFNHFVVFEGKKGNYYYLNDPAEGRRKLTEEELDDGYTGITIQFSKGEGFQKEKQKKTLLTFIKARLKGQEQSILSLLIIGLFLVIPGLMKF
jgi:ABC-type bacteriocin/lantibiotic exporter with double-glycine peptidase domain